MPEYKKDFKDPEAHTEQVRKAEQAMKRNALKDRSGPRPPQPRKPAKITPNKPTAPLTPAPGNPGKPGKSRKPKRY